MLWRTWESIKEGWGHISCKCSQMLVKVHQLCTWDWKNLFLESPQPPEARAAMLPSCLVYLCVCGLEQCSQSWNEKRNQAQTHPRIYWCLCARTFEFTVSISLFVVGVCIVARDFSCRGSRSPTVMKCYSRVVSPSVRVIRWYVATENNCWVCLCGAAAFVQ